MVSFILFLLSILSVTFAQEQKTFSNFSIGLLFSPNYSYRTVISNDGDIIGNSMIDFESEKNIPKFGYTTGIVIDYAVSKNFMLQSGIQFSNYGFQTKKLKLYNPAFDASIPSSIASIYNCYYLDLPISIKYYFIKQKFKFYVLCGVIENFYLSSNTITELYYENDNIEKNKKVNTIKFYFLDISGQLGIGCNYQINSKFNVFVQPSFKYMLFPVLDSPLKQRFYVIGLNSGINFNF